MRSIWNGTIGFGLVTIPVRLYSASEERRVSFDMLDKNDGSRIRYKRVSERTGKEVPWEQIVKGYKNDDDTYTIVEDEDFERASSKKSQAIEIEAFVKASEVDYVLYRKPYFIEPQKGGAKAYNLVRDALEKTKRVGVATFVMRDKEHLSLIGVYRSALVLHQIRFAEEIRNPAELNLPESSTAKRELEMAINLIEQYAEKFDAEKYRDTYNEQLRKIIAEKSKGRKKATIEVFKPEVTSAQDLMAQLKASIESRRTKKAS